MQNVSRSLQKIIPIKEFDDEYDLQRDKNIISDSSSICDKDKQILEDYFLKKLKPNKIALQRKWDKCYIYRVVNSWKRELICFNKGNS